MDYAEVITHNTDPNEIDSDGDNMPDGWEVNYNLDPNNQSDDITDFDSDGLINVDEYTNSTDPTDEDSDDDGFLDGEEIDKGTDPLDPLSFPNSSIPGYNSMFLLLISIISMIGLVYFLGFNKKLKVMS